MGRSPLLDGVSPSLLNAIKRVGDNYGPYGVRITSGYRPGSGHSQHGRGKALDVELYDKKTGKAVPNYQNAESAATYQAFANAVYADAQKNDPALAAKLRWGGYFGNDPGTGKPKYGSLDLMHFDEAGDKIGMRGGSWKEGFSPDMQKYWKIAAQGAAGSAAPAASGVAAEAAAAGAAANAKLTAAAAGPGDPRGMAAHIRATAMKYGIDPEVALRVAKSEGLSSHQSTFVKDGKREPSWGAFQLYTGGGLGNEFQKETGLDPSDPKNERATIDYALKRASSDGWGAWYGAKRVGVGDREGIGHAPPRLTSTEYNDPTPNVGAGESAYTTPGSDMPNDPTPNVGSGAGDYDATSSPTEVAAGASTLGKGLGDKAGDAFAGLADIFSKGPVAQNAARASGPANVPGSGAVTPPAGVIPTVDPKQAEMQRQMLALAMQRLNSGKLV